MKASDVLVKALENEGVEYVFAVPGEENLDVVESLRNSSIKLIVNRHEQVSAFMAAVYGKLTGKPGVCMSTLGPGATNLVTGVAYSYLCGYPMIVLTGQKAAINQWQGNFQILDVVNMFKPLTKKAESVTNQNEIPALVRNAFDIALSPKQGPVHIELPEDVADFDVENPVIKKPYESVSPVSNDEEIERAKEMIMNAKSPLVIAAGKANLSEVSKALVEFSEKTGIHVINTQMGKGAFPEDHENSLRSFGVHKQDYVNCAIGKADLLITVGYDIVEHPPKVWNEAKDKKILHIGNTIPEPDEFYVPDLLVDGDIADALMRLSGMIDHKWNVEYFHKLRSFVDEKYLDLVDADDVPLKPQRIVSDIRKVMGPEDIVTLDNGIYKLWFARQYQTLAPQTLLFDNCLATMGAGLPTAMAAKMVYPDRKVLAVAGDGGFMMNSQDLITAIKYNLDVTVLILNDNAYGFIRWKQANMGFDDFGMELTNPDFVKYAESYGAKAYRVEKAGDLEKYLKESFDTKGVKLIECPIDYNENKRVFTDEIGSAEICIF